MPGYVDPLHDFFHSTWKFCISLKEWTCSSILRHCTVLIGTPFGICISKFVPEEIGTPFGICISKFVPEEASHFSISMDTIDILSSSSEDEIEVRCIGETPFQKEAVASSVDSAGRKLLSWASTSSSNSIYASKPSQDLCLRTTMPAFNSRNKDRISNEREKAQLGSEYGSLAAPPDEVKRQLYFMSTSDEKASNHHTSNLTLYSNPVSEVDGKSLSQNTPRILPNTLQRPMPTSESKFDRKSLSQNTPRILPSTFQQAMSASESKVDGKSLSQNTPRILSNTLQPPMPTSESKASMGSGGYVSIHDFHGDTNHPVGANAADRKTYTQDSGVEKVDGKSLSQNTPRILPNTLHQPMSTSESKVNGKSLSQNTPRILPNTLQRPMSTSESKASMGSGGYVPIHGFHGDTYHPVGANAADRKTYTKDSGVEKDGAIIYEKRRLLPPTLMHGKAVTDSQPVSMNAATLRSGVGEERPMENDERLIFQAALQDLAQPKLEANLPEGILTVTLLRHQKIALAWMLQKETASLHCLGGILADDQGLGKTISMIALIQMQKSLQSKSTSDSLRHIKAAALNLVEDDDNVSDLEIIKQTEKPDDLERMPVASTSIPLFHKGRPAAGTLVVCPASVLRQWARELNEKVTESAKLSVLVYHGSTRTKDPVELAKYDVVLTTYSIVSNEVPKLPLVDDDDEEQRNMEKYAISSDFSTNKKRKKIANAVNKKKNRKGNGGSSLDYDSGPLARVGWFRVILDEAQTIKNYRTQVARACCGLRAKRRWCLSGTPIQNSIDDLYSYFRFLKYDPYAVYKSFCSTIKYQISRNASTGYKKLQAVLKTVMLRRTKGDLIIFFF